MGLLSPALSSIRLAAAKRFGAAGWRGGGGRTACCISDILLASLGYFKLEYVFRNRLVRGAQDFRAQFVATCLFCFPLHHTQLLHGVFGQGEVLLARMPDGAVCIHDPPANGGIGDGIPLVVDRPEVASEQFPALPVVAVVFQ